jgi:hypothetical protein
MANMLTVLLILALWAANFAVARAIGARAGMKYEASWLAGLLCVLGTLIFLAILAIDGPRTIKGDGNYEN